ncbi:MAG: glycerophosphodiester phosphodiesterase [Betaproteobacteria bacterium]|nr:glycerophosphodiester phosphodiesterase [Betaproteobacteria bacterium]
MNPWPYPTHIAHRGGGSLAPENTLAAMRVGFSHGYRMVEFDAKLCGDGSIILMHDATLERTTDGTGRVAARPWGEIARLDAGAWHSSAFVGEPVPRLASVARYLIANGMLCNIEIKPCPGRERETAAAIALEAQELWAGAAVPPLLSSFSERALEIAGRVAPELPRGLLLDEPAEGWLLRAARLGCKSIHLNQRHATPERITTGHQAGFRLLAYTVNDPARAAELLGAGMDGIFTDALDRIAVAR